jgi:hypothetical protein
LLAICKTKSAWKLVPRNEARFGGVSPAQRRILAGPVPRVRLFEVAIHEMRIDMNWKSGVYALAAVMMLAAGPAWAGCSPSDRIDGTTADMAKHRIEQAGYSQVTDLSKGCDNYWHAIAMKNGASVGVVVSPTGEVMTEGS